MEVESPSEPYLLDLLAWLLFSLRFLPLFFSARTFECTAVFMARRLLRPSVTSEAAGSSRLMVSSVTSSLSSTMAAPVPLCTLTAQRSSTRKAAWSVPISDRSRALTVTLGFTEQCRFR